MAMKMHICLCFVESNSVMPLDRSSTCVVTDGYNQWLGVLWSIHCFFKIFFLKLYGCSKVWKSGSKWIYFSFIYLCFCAERPMVVERASEHNSGFFPDIFYHFHRSVSSVLIHPYELR